MRPGMLIIISFTLSVLYSCSQQKENRSGDTGLQNGSSVIYAERFTLEENDSCTIVTIINPWQGAEDISNKYYLVRKESNIPVNADPSKIIYVPVEKIICMSTTHLAMISALGENNSIAAVSGTGFIYNPLLSARISTGHVKDVGFEAGMNSELILQLKPDIVMMYGIGGESAGYTGKIEELGINVVFNADYLEPHPLGKAEWIKLFGALYCKERMADSIYISVSESYNTIKTAVERNNGIRPRVLLGLPYKDTWFISPGNSYISRLINDAGGNYLWEETESAFSMPLGIEDVFIKALKADFWFNTGTARSKNEIVSLDPRLGIIPAFRNGNIFNNNKRITVTGGNDYWETGALHPDILLKDIASVLHPGLFREHQLYYFRKIE